MAQTQPHRAAIEKLQASPSHWTGQLTESRKVELPNTRREEFRKQATVLDYRGPAEEKCLNVV
jgi:hypothetical protein